MAVVSCHLIIITAWARTVTVCKHCWFHCDILMCDASIVFGIMGSCAAENTVVVLACQNYGQEAYVQWTLAQCVATVVG